MEEDSCSKDNASSHEANKVLALACFFVCKLCAGLASQAYWTLGIAYMDDNVKSGAAAAVIGGCYMVGFVGGFCGNLLGSACLRLNVDGLGPVMEGSLGAWWLGWPLIAVVHTCLATGFLFLPHHLPTTKTEEEASESMGTTTPNFKLRFILDDLKRLVKNRVLMCGK